MTSTVYYGSPQQSRLEAKETLPAKLDLILEQLKLRERVKDETVVIKLPKEQKALFVPYLHKHLFNYAKGYDAAWVDPNEELMPK